MKFSKKNYPSHILEIDVEWNSNFAPFIPMPISLLFSSANEVKKKKKELINIFL